MDQRLGLGAAMRLDHADHDIDARRAPRRAFGQHLIGLADAGGGAEQHLQTPAALLRGGAQKGLGVGTLLGIGLRTHSRLLRLPPSLSSARLSASTLTRGSPRKPSSAPFDMLPHQRADGPSQPRAAATRPPGKGRLGADMGVEPRGGGGHQIGGDRNCAGDVAKRRCRPSRGRRAPGWWGRDSIRRGAAS
jgi:hypothetical protein